ncbi:MAG: type II toxin-antitoxin system VapC family toxin [Gammaproteobacteria bacterium]|nr:type II toxin-antitoxin system VapC family toxin [Gammaproteobacteria bacterium]
MIALDPNVVVRYLVRDEERQAEEARAVFATLAADHPAFGC